MSPNETESVRETVHQAAVSQSHKRILEEGRPNAARWGWAVWDAHLHIVIDQLRGEAGDKQDSVGSSIVRLGVLMPPGDSFPTG